VHYALLHEYMQLTIDPPAFVMFSVKMKIPQIVRNVKMFNHGVLCEGGVKLEADISKQKAESSKLKAQGWKQGIHRPG
jgi:hypothetical protein